MYNFRKLDVWNKSTDLAVKLYIFSNEFPNNEIFGLVSQIRRAAVSIPSNIAEGCSRSSSTDMNRFLQISIGSANELITQLEITKRAGLAPPNECDLFIQNLDHIIAMLYGLRKSNNINTNRSSAPRSGVEKRAKRTIKEQV